MSQLMSASLMTTRSSKPLVDARSPSPSPSYSSKQNSIEGSSRSQEAIEPLLRHLQSCVLCKQELVLALLRDGQWNDPTTLMDIVNALSNVISLQRLDEYEPYKGRKDQIQESPVEEAEKVCDYYFAEDDLVVTKDITSSYTSSVHDNDDDINTMRRQYSAAHNCEPLLKRQNAFEKHLNNYQGSFESTSAAESEWLIDCEADEFCEDEYNLGVGSTLIPDPTNYYPIFYQQLPKRQNAFEIPSEALTGEDWSKYI